MDDFPKHVARVSRFEDGHPTPETAAYWSQLTPARVAMALRRFHTGDTPWAAPLVRLAREAPEAAQMARVAIQRLLAYANDQTRLPDDQRLTAPVIRRIASEIVIGSLLPLVGVVNALRMGSQHRLTDKRGEVIRPYGALTEGMVWEWLASYERLLEKETRRSAEAERRAQAREEERARAELQADPEYQQRLREARDAAIASIEEHLEEAPLARTLVDFLRNGDG